MTTCMRCGTELTIDQRNRRYLDANGSISCPASHPGEAGVHRVADHIRPPRTPWQQYEYERDRNWEKWMGYLSQAVVGYSLGNLTGRILGAGRGPSSEQIVNHVHDVLGGDF